MCVSALVETDLERIGTALGLSNLGAVNAPLDDAGGMPRRAEARGLAWVVRLGTAGMLVAEPMAFNPYVVRRRNIAGDMWVSSLLTANHGLLVLRGFSEWVNADALVALGLVSEYDVHCAFNRVSAGGQLLANFVPMAPMLVPVLYDLSRGSAEFVMVSDDPALSMQRAGLAQLPHSLTLAAAHDWLQVVTTNVGDSGELEAAAEDPAFATAFEEVLEDCRAEPLNFSLYKSAG